MTGHDPRSFPLVEEATIARRTIIWSSLVMSVVIGVVAALDPGDRGYSVQGSGDAAQVLATLLVAIAVEARVLSTTIRLSPHDLPLRVASGLISTLVFVGTALATGSAMRGEVFDRLGGALVLAAVAALLGLVLGIAFLGAYLSDR